jgi:hypothetical protein
MMNMKYRHALIIFTPKKGRAVDVQHHLNKAIEENPRCLELYELTRDPTGRSYSYGLKVDSEYTGEIRSELGSLLEYMCEDVLSGGITDVIYYANRPFVSTPPCSPQSTD